MRRTLSSIIVLSVAATALVVAAPAAHAVNGRIALVSGRSSPNQTGLFEVFTVDEMGAGLVVNVTHAPRAVDVDPSWDPTQDRIVFARQSANSETFNLLTTVPGQPGTTSLTTGSSSDRQPDWSSTGQIAFTRTTRGASTSHVYRINAAGAGLTQLTSTPAPGFDSSPAWSPDGSQIAFVSDRAGGIPQIFTMDGAGGGQTQRTFEGCFASNPSWIGSTALVYERQCPGAPGDIFRLDLFPAVSSTGLIVGPESDHQPAASPEGDRIAFTRIMPDGDKDIYLANVTPPASPTPISSNTTAADMAADWGSVATSPRPADEALAPSITVPAAAPSRSADTQETRAPSKKKKKGKKKKKKKKFKVSPGVKYRRFRKAKSDAYLLKVNPRTRATIDVALGHDRLPGRERVKGMAKRHGAVAGINGDFGMPPAGQPSHTFAKDGDLKQMSYAVAWNFAISRDEQRTFVDRPFETITAVETDTWRIDRWTFGTPAFNDITGFTPAAGNLASPPPNACAARLTPTAGPRWAPDMMGVETPYAVSATGCSGSPMGVNGGIVLAARPGSDGALLLQSLAIGESVELTWSVGWEQVVDTVGGTPLLVSEGKKVAKKCNQSICRKHPRTAIGVTGNGRILMLVVDGRTKRSKGVTTVKLAQIMRSLGAVFALNLDGGGSSTMVVRGKVMNRPSDGKPRRVSSSVLVLDGPDADEAIGAAQPRMAAPLVGGPTADDIAALLDPASTGGLLEAMAEGAFGPRVDLPRVLDRALHRFRSAA